jgi:hypothetical protein
MIKCFSSLMRAKALFYYLIKVIKVIKNMAYLILFKVIKVNFTI